MRKPDAAAELPKREEAKQPRSQAQCKWSYADINPAAFYNPVRWSYKKTVGDALAAILSANPNFTRPVHIKLYTDAAGKECFKVTSQAEFFKKCHMTPGGAAPVPTDCHSTASASDLMRKPDAAAELPKREEAKQPRSQALEERLAAEKVARKKKVEEDHIEAERKAEEQRLADEAAAKKAEEERLAAEEAARKKKEEEDRIEAERKAEEQRLADEAKAKKAEEERLAAEEAAKKKKEEKDRIEAERKAEEQRLADEATAKKAEEERLAAEEAARKKKDEEDRIEAERKAEEQRLADEAAAKKAEEERLVAEAAKKKKATDVVDGFSLQPMSVEHINLIWQVPCDVEEPVCHAQTSLVRGNRFSL
jgi:hypothetical protein